MQIMMKPVTGKEFFELLSLSHLGSEWLRDVCERARGLADKAWRLPKSVFLMPYALHHW
jgi:hypothetical protein